MAFHDVAFPMFIAKGAEGGPRRRTRVVGSESGHEARNSSWKKSRRVYRFSVAADELDAQDALLHHFEGREGNLFSFPFRDYADYKSCAPMETPAATDQAIGAGDGVETDFQLVKTYEPGGSNPQVRKIVRPIVSSVVVALDGTPQASGWSVARLTGILAFDVAPGAGVQVTAGYLFDTVTRYDHDELPATFVSPTVVEYNDITLIEVFGE